MLNNIEINLVLIIISLVIGMFIGVYIEYFYLEELTNDEIINRMNKRRKRHEK